VVVCVLCMVVLMLITFILCYALAIWAELERINSELDRDFERAIRALVAREKRRRDC